MKCECGCGRRIRRSLTKPRKYATNACRQRAWRRMRKEMRNQIDVRFPVNEAQINSVEMWHDSQL